MLDKTRTRQLCYVVKIDDIKPILGSDNCECAVVGGWTVMVRKNTFTTGDLAIYFEIDSQVDITQPEFEFLKGKHGKIKIQKYTFGGRNKEGFYSQGLLMPASDFGWQVCEYRGEKFILDDENFSHKPGEESMFLTKRLDVTYASADDRKRKKVNPDAKINAVLARYPKIAKKYGKFIKSHKFVRKLFLLLFGRKTNVANWPSHIASKTAVERLQNMMYVLNDKQPYVATEKVDGSSASFMAERKAFNKIDYYVCSRNVVFKDANQNCYYDENIYWQMYEKYGIKDILTRLLKDYSLDNIAIQGEVYGAGVQKRDYSTEEKKLAIFHIVSNGQKFSMDQVVEICDKYGLPHVPIVDDNYILPDTIEEVRTFVESAPSVIDGKEKEGIVFYDKETGEQYFKYVSPDFLLKYHGYGRS